MLSRHDRRAPLDIYVNKVIDGVPHLARTRNISRTGLYLHRLLEPVAPDGARINVEIHLPGEEDDDVLWLDAVVVRDERGGMALRFLDLRPGERARIEYYIAKAVHFPKTLH